MITQPVMSRQQLEGRLHDVGAEKTDQRTDTAEIWRLPNGRHFTVPDSVQGYYPDWLLRDLEEIVGRLEPWVRRPN